VEMERYNKKFLIASSATRHYIQHITQRCRIVKSVSRLFLNPAPASHPYNYNKLERIAKRGC